MSDAVWIEYHFPRSFLLTMTALLLLAAGVTEEREDSTEAVDGSGRDRAGRAPREGRSPSLLVRISLSDLIDGPFLPRTWGEA